MVIEKWKYNNKSVNGVTDMPDDAIGFVYLIVTSNGKKYIGKKSLYSVRKRKFGKKESKLITDKRKKLYEMVKKESDWQIYTGSNKDLNEDIKKGITFTREILQYAYAKKQLSYLETKYLFVKGVLETDDEYYNSNINGTYFRKDASSIDDE
jgi:hypothetical protein